MKLLLVTMPWASLDTPSLALSVLVGLAKQSPHVSEVRALYGNLRWADCMLEQTAQAYRPADYERISEGYFTGTGDWIFSGALYGEREPTRTRFYSFAAEKGLDLTDASAAYRQAVPFIEALADEIVESRPDIVGFTTTFLQTVPSLALAKAIKTRSPGTVVVFGGANCDGVQGRAIHESFPFVDYVVRSEAELVLPELFELLAGDPTASGDTRDTAAGRIPGLCWRDRDSRPRANSLSGSPVLMDQVPSPVPDDYFAALRHTTMRTWIEPRIWLEGSRGCWWGAKHHCTFCGLNGTTMNYRSKPGERLWAEVLENVARFRVLDVMLADNILDMAYLDTFLPLAAASDLDLRIFCEIKSNLSYGQLAKLAAAHVVDVQPGIENLSSRVLALMRKGVTAIHNVRLLRDCATLALTASWNYLYGFPGELDEDYEPVMAQLPMLAHLQPPSAAVRLNLERFSPYFDDPSLGLIELGPAWPYREIHPLPPDILRDLVYLYDSEPAGIGAGVLGRLRAGVATWQKDYPNSSLTMVDADDGGLVIEDRRASTAPVDHYLDAGIESDAYRALLPGRSVTGLRRALADREQRPTDDQLDDLLAQWRQAGLVFQENDKYVSLAAGAPASARSHLHRSQTKGRAHADSARWPQLPVVG